MPQGSLNCPILYLVHASSLKDRNSDGTQIYGFADDNALRKTFKNSDQNRNETLVVPDLENILVNVKDWMDLNRLKMNCLKTEFIVIGEC